MTKEKEDKKPVVFYCNRGQYTFSLPEYERDEFGKLIVENGKKKKLFVTDADGNNRHVVQVSFQFERVPVKDKKTGKTSAMIHLGRFICDPANERYEDLVRYLADAKKNGLSGLMSEDEYKKDYNAEAYAFEKQVATLNSDMDELRKRNEAMEEVLKQKGFNVDKILKEKGVLIE